MDMLKRILSALSGKKKTIHILVSGSAYCLNY